MKLQPSLYFVAVASEFCRRWAVHPNSLKQQKLMCLHINENCDKPLETRCGLKKGNTSDMCR